MANIHNPDSKPCIKGGDRHMTSVMTREHREPKRRRCVWCGRSETRVKGVWVVDTPQAEPLVDKRD